MPNKQAEAHVITWLSQAHPEPGWVQREWATRAAALVPLGHTFAAIRLTGGLVHATLGVNEVGAVAQALAELLEGPVICDPRPSRPGLYYPLVPANVEPAWEHDQRAEFLGSGVYLGIPRLDCVRPPGPHWAVAPRRAGDLCRPDVVAALVTTGVGGAG
ncbi:hypothetical protein [Streptomyces hokutonensis]|uniref:hypothetical protein n=1 Tax=Streptomyces hokutonensis TaxID=1306990 RepID=UPI00035FB423|nr:hypothetical protein [Streptomyces hokutonensis]